MYKKILSLCLVLLLALSCVSVSVSAYDPLPEEELIKLVLKEAYLEQWLKDYGDVYPDNSEFDGTLEYFYYIGDAGCHVFQAAAIPGSPVEPTDVIGDYRFTAGMCMSYCDTNPAGMYAYKDGELMTLREAYEKGLVDLDLLYEISDKNYVIMPLTPEELLENKCRAEFMEEFGIATKDEDEVYVEFAAKFANYTVFRATLGGSPALETYDYIGGYWFFAGAIYGDEGSNPTGLYTLDNYGNVEELYKVVSEDYLDMDEIFPELSEKCGMYLAGDIDSDKRLTVKDATLIQKYLAKVPEAMDKVYDHILGVKVMDVDLSGGDALFGYEPSVNVKDATYIQKKVAKIYGDSERPWFSYDHITVGIEGKDVREYTLEDFPEYEFERIERWEYSSFDYVTLSLYLKHPGRENVIDAVNSLRYREGVDFSSVSVNPIVYPD
ncbi:MAG: dockerin type I repeat-containing protein [Clostridia bacterium]|nr:dockerin type I repeat-containing protein [Clostridia bacterium]